MHPRTKAKTKEISKLLLQLVGSAAVTWVSFGSLKNWKRSERVLGAFAGYSYWRVRETIKRLRMQDMIQYDENDLKSPIVLTEKGLRRLATHNIRDAFSNFFKKKKKWDYFWRIIFFDIPEKQRGVRDRLRKELISLGFYPYQKSVYVCPFSCEDLIEDFCKMYKISGRVLFCTAPSLGRKEGEIRAHFFSRGKPPKVKGQKE